MTKNTYEVINTIRSGNIDDGAPVDVRWYQGDNLSLAIAAMVQAAADHEDREDRASRLAWNLPENMRVRTLAVRLVITEEVEPEPEPEPEEVPDEPDRSGIDYLITWPEDHDHALSDCAWWDHQYQPWARVECSGRMAEVTMTNGGVTVTTAIMCEAHVNAYPEGPK